ncbi:MAG: glycosyltransferase family 2 protein [Candidatus Bathyarchaeia archaeon]
MAKDQSFPRMDTGSLHDRPATWFEALTVVLPALNEEEAVVSVVEELREAGYSRILLVDGHSTDRTVELAHRCGVKVIVQEGEGKAAAIRTAVQLVDTPYMLVMDCDGTYDPRDIKRLLDAGKSYDLVIGTRIIGRSNIPLMNRLGNWVITKAFDYMLGADLKDVCSGMYLIKTERARNLELTSKGFSVEADIASQMLMHGPVGQVPVSYRERIGKAKLSRWRDGFGILRSVFILARRHNPLFLFFILALGAGALSSIILLWVIYENLLHGVWHSGYALFGGILFLASIQCFTLAAFSVMLKRMEKRIERRVGL